MGSRASWGVSSGSTRGGTVCDQISGSVAERSVESPERYRVNFFGPFVVLRNGVPHARDSLGRSSSATLLKWFLLAPGRIGTRGELCSALWPGERPCAARLAATVHHLRRALEPDLEARAPSRFVHSVAGVGYKFDDRGIWETDLSMGRNHIAAAAQHQAAGNQSAAIADLERGLELMNGPFMPEDFYSEVFQDLRAEVDTQRKDAHIALLSLYMDQNLCHRALSLALAVQGTDPYSEVAALTVAHVHLRDGNRPAAAQHLEQYVAMMQREVGTPDPRIVRLLRKIKSGEPAR